MSKIVGYSLAAFLIWGTVSYCTKEVERSRESDRANALQEQMFRHELCNRNGVPVWRCNNVDIPPVTWVKWLKQDTREMDRKQGIK